jgi:PIN domain nuclease of toxin-antitoxin system
MGIRQQVVLDTHEWIWLITGDARLHPALSSGQLSGRPVISAITIWECMLLIQKGRIKTRSSAEATVREWLDLYPVEVHSVTAEIAILSRSLPFAHDDSGDRIIGATAHHLRLPLVTRDQALLSLPWLQTL